MNKIIDAHMHFNMKKENPVDDLINQIELNNIVGGVLILNSDEEKRAFVKSVSNKVLLNKNIRIATLYDIKKQEDIEFIKYLDGTGIDFLIKLHPRISDIQKKDFETYLEGLKKFEKKDIIIDGFYYGENLENHISIEFTIYLATNLNDRNIVLAHSGGIKILECMLYTRKIENLYYDLSLTATYLKNSSVYIDIINFLKYNYKKVFFGSDYPDFTMKEAIDSMMIICKKAELSEDKIDMVFAENAIKFYKL